MIGRRLAATVSAVALAAGCSGGEPDTVKATGTLVVGATLELTGSGAAGGTAAGNALKIAADQVNAAGVEVGGRTMTVRVVVRDNRSDPRTAAEQARELVTDEHAAVLIGGTRLETATAVANVAQSRQVPMLGLAPENSLVRPAPDHRYVFKLPANADDVARLIATRLHRDARTPVAVLAVAGPYGDEGASAATAALADAGVAAAGVTRFPVDAGPAEPGLYEAARQVTTAQPAAAVIWAPVPAAGQAAAALRAAGFGGQIVFDPGAGGSETLAAANRPAVENSLLAHPAVFDVDRALGNDPLGLARQRFFERYTRAYGSFNGLAAYASDALDIVVTAAAATPDATPQQLRDAMERTRRQGLTGSYAFSTTNHGGVAPDQLTIFRCERGRWVRT